MLKKWSLCNLKASTLVKPSQSRKKKTSYNAVTRSMYLKFFTAYYQTSLFQRGLFVLWGGWGERKRERAGLPIVPRALSIFSIIDILMGIPSGSLCGGESVKPQSWLTALWRTDHCIIYFEINSLSKGAVSRNSAKLGNYKMPAVKLRET